MPLSANKISTELAVAQELAYTPLGLRLKNLVKEPESAGYSAATFELNNRRIHYRVAKTTPKKIGQFVTLWKRTGAGGIAPYDEGDAVDLFVISVRCAQHFGQFVFPKAVLCEKGIVSCNNAGGKRGFRVYPPWDIPDNRQAIKTQMWQLKYFFEMPSSGCRERQDIARLFGGDNALWMRSISSPTISGNKNYRK